MKKVIEECKPVFFMLVVSSLYYISMHCIQSWLPDLYKISLVVLLAPVLLTYFYIWKKYFMDLSYFKSFQIVYYIVFIFLIIHEFSVAYQMLYTCDKRSFNIQNNSGDLGIDFGYFSLVTIATVGYGDIVPVTAAAKTLVSMEIFTGIILLILIVSNFHIFFKVPDNKSD